MHSILDGLFQVILFVAGYSVQLSNLTTIFTSAIVVPMELSHQWVIIPVGLAAIVVWFLVFRFLILKLDLKTPGREDEGEEIDLSQMNAQTVAAAKKGGATAAMAGEAAISVQPIIDGLGGPENIDSVINCFTRLRIDLKDMDKLDEATINQYPNKGIVKSKGNVQIIIGMKVQDVCEQVNKALGRTME